MQARCNDRTHPRYKNYGGRGIKICVRWDSFENFFTDMGAKPHPSYTIDRIDVNGMYAPTNCRWLARKEQYRNMTRTVYVEHEGKKVSLIDLVASLGLSRSIVYGRLKNRWPLDKALTVPVRKNKKTVRK